VPRDQDRRQRFRLLHARRPRVAHCGHSGQRCLREGRRPKGRGRSCGRARRQRRRWCRRSGGGRRGAPGVSAHPPCGAQRQPQGARVVGQATEPEQSLRRRRAVVVVVVVVVAAAAATVVVPVAVRAALERQERVRAGAGPPGRPADAAPRGRRRRRRPAARAGGRLRDGAAHAAADARASAWQRAAPAAVRGQPRASRVLCRCCRCCVPVLVVFCWWSTPWFIVVVAALAAVPAALHPGTWC
jgi:hypothetical protein